MPVQQNPAIENMMANFDYDSPETKEQLAQAGTSSDEVSSCYMCAWLGGGLIF